MFKAKIEVGYKDDWSVDLMSLFNCEMESIYCQNISQCEVVDVIKMKYDLEFEKNFKGFFEKYNYIKKYEIIDKTEDYIFFKIHTICDSNNEKFVKNNCFQFGSIVLKDGKEYWEVISSSKNNFKKLLEDLKSNENNKMANLICLETYDFKKNNLTEKQFEVLIFLFKNGYFEIPKRINLDESARELNMSKSNLNVHLNKAIYKIINDFF